MNDPSDDALLRDAPDNIFARIARRHAGHPPEVQPEGLTRDVGKAIPFVGTAGLGVEVLRPTRVVTTLAPGPSTQNHIGGTHAGALALLAETATGLIVAQNVPAESAPVLRSLGVEYERRATGMLRAEARLPAEEVERIRARPIGKVEAAVTVHDESGAQPIRATLRWAWLPRRKVGLD